LDDKDDDGAAATLVFESVGFWIVDFLDKCVFSFCKTLFNGFYWMLWEAKFINDKSVEIVSQEIGA